MAEGQVRLDLQVGLDTAYLQGQLATIGTRLAGQGINLAVKFDKQTIADQYRLLNRYIGRKTFDVKIESNTLEALTAKVKNFEDRLKRLQGETIKLDVEVGGIASIKNKDEARKIRTELRDQILSEGGKIRIETSIIPKITKEDIDNFKAVVQSKLAGLKVKVGVEPSVTTGGAATGGRQRPAGFTAARESIANLNVEQLRSRAFKSLGQESRAAQQVSQWLDNIVTQGLKGADKTRQLSAVRDFLADALAQVARKDIQASLRQPDPNRRGPFPNVAKTGPIESKLLFQEAMQIAAAVDAAYARTAQAMAQQSAQLRAASSRLLPPGREAIAGGSAQQKAVQDFYARMRQAEQMFARHFSANSYLPVASRNLAKAMNVARQQLLLPGRRVAGALPSSEMRAALQFRQARESAAAIDAANAERFRARQAREASRSQLIAARAQLQVPLLPAARQTAGAGMASRSLQGQSFAAPSLPPNFRASSFSDRLSRTFIEMQQEGIRGVLSSLFASIAKGISPSLGAGPRGGYGPVAGGGRPPRGPQPPQGMGGGGGGQPPSRGGALVPYAPATQLPSGYFEAGRFANALRGTESSLRQSRVPLAGAIAELGNEFAEATKNVLLYGTAYKALAFVVDLPNQALQAATALQTFRNQLLAITGSAETADRSFAFVDNLANRFAVPLESARSGFIKLYASMQPAGFGGAEIENLFTGVSKAAATLGLSSDKVDRVTYAFSQMASKGQVMAEELRGQLGDVLPGSLALFAKAAQMEIPQFTKAMEDGRFAGDAMKVLLNNVAVLMNTKFATGAEGAAKTLQGSLNQMSTGLTRFYEAFEPIVNIVAQRVFPMIAESVGSATSAVKAFAAAAQGNNSPAQQLSGQALSIYQAFGQVAEIGKALARVFQDLAPTFVTLGQTVLFVVAQIARFTSTPIGGFLTSMTLNVVLVRTALQLLARTGILGVVSALIPMVSAMRNATTIMGALRIGAIQLGSAIGALAAPVLLGGIMLLVQRFMSLQGAIDGVRQSTQGMLANISSMAQSGALAPLRNMAADLRNQLSTFSSLTPFVQGGAFGPSRSLTESAFGKMQELGLGGFVAKDVLGKPFVRDPKNAANLINARIQSIRKQLESIQQKLPEAEQAAAALAPAATLQAIPESPIDPEKAGKDAEKLAEEERRRREQATSQEQQRILALADMRNQLDQIGFDKYKALNEDALDFARRMIDAEFDYREARANRFGKMQIDIARKVGEQQQNIDEALLKYRMGIMEGQVKAAAAQAKAAAADQADALAPVLTAAGVIAKTGGAVTQDPTTRGRSSGPHLHAQGAGMTERQLRYLVDKYLDVGGKSASSFGQSRGAAGHIDFLTPQGTPIKLKPGASISQYGPAGGRGGLMGEVSTPEGKFQLGHLLSLSTGGAPVSGTAFATEKRGEAAKRDAQIAQQQAAADAEINSQRLLNSLREAEANTKTIIAQAMDRVLPLEEQRLENMLSETRLSAQLAGLSDAQVEALMKQKEATMGTEATVAGFRDSIATLKNAQLEYDKQLSDGTINQYAHSEATKINNGMIQELEKSIADANVQLPLFNQELERTAAIEELARPFVALATAIRDAKQSLADMANPLFQTISIAEGVGNAFGETFRGLISGAASTREALAGFFQSLSDMFADMVAKMLAEWARLQIMKLFSPAGGGSGLLGFDLASSSSSLLSSGLGAASSSVAFNPLAFSGVQLFAKGGVVTGPTMGLVGEGRFNEAVVPLPDGKSIPVSLNGGGSGGTNVVVNVDAKGTSVQGDDMMGKQLGTAISSAVQAELIKQQRPGGLLSSPRR